VADVVLVKGISHVPEPLRITVTDYIFHVREMIKGDPGLTHLDVRNPGGELANGIGMETLDSYKLTAGQRYIVFARKTSTGYALKDVLQVARDGAVMATAAGRVIVGLHQGNALTRPEVFFRPLRYRPVPPAPAPIPQGPPDKGSFPVAKVELPTVALAKADP